MSGSLAHMDAFFQHSAITPITDDPGVSAKAGHITVRVAVNYLPEQSRVEAGKWFWVYHIRIENHSQEPVKLLTRHWRITDGRGMVQSVDGDGVVGEQPLIAPGAAHDYVSGCPLGTPNGSMQGTTQCVGAIGRESNRNCSKWRSRSSRSPRLPPPMAHRPKAASGPDMTSKPVSAAA